MVIAPPPRAIAMPRTATASATVPSPRASCVMRQGRWGDVNGDSISTTMGDGVVNIIDAQQIARYTVGLAVGNRPGIVAVGDVNADSVVNIIDAQQIARYSVGLTAAARISSAVSVPPAIALVVVGRVPKGVSVGGTVNLTAEPRDVLGTPQTDCVTLTWASSDTAIARVDGNGAVVGVAAGLATITATAGARQGSTVVASYVPVRFRVVAGGGYHACALATTDVAYCWGRGDNGQLGSGTATSGETCTYNGIGSPWPCESRPWRVSAGTMTFATLSAGSANSCAGTAGGQWYCWGRGLAGSLGSGQNAGANVPTPVAGGLSFISVALRYTGGCALTAAGAAYCWGSALAGELGIGPVSAGGQCGALEACSTVPVAVVGSHSFRQIGAGGDNGLHTCAVTDAGVAYCWGINEYDELGATTTETCSSSNIPCSTVPIAVSGGLTFRIVVAGSFDTCGLAADSTAYCWGSNVSAGFWFAASPTAVPGGRRFASITKAGGHTCGLTAAGDAYCWGQGNYGTLGNGATEHQSTPVSVSGGLKFKMLSAGSFMTCGITLDGLSYCWGLNQYGMLGNPDSADHCDDGFAVYSCSTTPLEVFGQSPSPPPAARSIHAGSAPDRAP